jgi:hypothetical protein
MPTHDESALAALSVAWLSLNAIALAKASTDGSIPRPAGRSLVAVAAGSLAVGAATTLLELANNRFLDDVNARIAPPSTDPEERLLRTLEYVSRYRFEEFDARRIHSRLHRIIGTMEAASPLHVSARTAITGGTDHIGPCGALGRTLIVLLKRAGIEARKAQIYDDAGCPQHTVVEVRLAGRWRVVDPTYSMVWRRPGDGELATADEIAADRELFERVVEHNPDYPTNRYTYANLHHLHWEKFPALKQLRTRMRSWIGDDYVRAIPTPYIYERPGYLISGLSYGLATVLAFVVLRQRRHT